MVTTTTLLALVGAFFLAVMVPLSISSYANHYGSTKRGFLLGNSSLGFWLAAFSIGIGWMWSPALFIASFQSYTNGLTGAFWMLAGNVTTLILFGYGAHKIIEKVPDGFTFSGYMRETYGPGMQRTYLLIMSLITIIPISSLLTSLSTVLSILSGIEVLWIAIACMISVLLLSFWSGYMASIYADVVKGLIIYTVFTGFAIYLYMNGATPDWDGVTNKGYELVGTSYSWAIFAGFGATFTLALLSSPWVDNAFTQMAYSVKDKTQIRRTFTWAAVFFTIGISLTLLVGFLMASKGVTVPKGRENFTMVYGVQQLIGPTGVLLLVLAAFAGVISVIDTLLSSLSSFVAHDLAQNRGWNEKTALWTSRMTILVVGPIAVWVANSGVSLIYLLLLGSIIKASMGLTTAGMVLRPQWFSPKVMQPLLLISLSTAAVAYIWCSNNKVPNFQLWLSVIFGFGTPLLGILLSRKWR